MSTYLLPASAIAGSVYFSNYLDTTKDIVVSFDYACYGTDPSGSEGFCVFFVNSYTGGVVLSGAPGPGLGYSYASNIAVEGISQTIFSGIEYGELGIGFDLTGNFSSQNYGVSGLLTPVPNSISVRSSFNSAYSLVYNSGTTLSDNAFSLYQQISAGQTPTFNRMRVRLTDFGNRVVVDVKRPGDISFTNLVDTPTYTTLPASVFCGLSFTTGTVGSTVLKLENFNVNGITTTAISPNNQSFFIYSILPNQSYYGGVSAMKFIPISQKYNGSSLGSILLDPFDSLSAINVDANGYPSYTNDPILSASLITVVSGLGIQPYTNADQYILPIIFSQV
jgi:hypothetical protein